MAVLSWVVFGYPLRNWAMAAAIAIATLLVLHIVKWAAIKYLQALSRRTTTKFDDVLSGVVQQTHFLFLLFLAAYFGSLALPLPEKADQRFQALVIVALLVQAAIWGNGLVSFWLARYKERLADQDGATATTATALAFLSRLVLWTTVTLMALQNLGIRVDTLIAGLGIGGIAVALAVQNILSDLFASLSIVLDKPFLIGDYIVVGEHSGTVQHIGLKTTRLRSLTGEQLIFANSDLLNTRIRNFKRMQERRISFNVSVAYTTPYEKLEQIPRLIREIVESHEQVRFDRAHFHEYGPYSLNFPVVYWVTSPDYALYMDIQQSINLSLHRRFEEEGIQFALPMQNVFVTNDTVSAP